MRGVILSFLLCCPTPILAAGPIADVLCAPSADMQARLTTQYRSEKTAYGVRNPEEVMEVWTDARGEWAMVIRYSSGTSCIVAMGEYWQQIDTPEPS